MSTTLRGMPECRRLLVWVMLSCITCCAQPGQQKHATAVANAVAELPIGTRYTAAVVQRLFAAAQGLHGTGDVAAALRVLALCGRLDNGHADLALATAEMRCHAGDLAGAHAGFRLAGALAQRRCPDYAEPPDRRRCPDLALSEALGLMVSASARHGMCLMGARRFGDAAKRFREALAFNSVRLPLSFPPRARAVQPLSA